MIIPKLILFVIFSVGLYITASAQTPEPKKAVVQYRPTPVERVYNPEFSGKPEQEIELLEHQMSDAVRNKDERLEKLLSDSVLIAGVIADKKTYIALLRQIDTKFISIEKSEMRIVIHGDTAIATGIQKADIELENGGKMSQTIFINTWRRVDGAWQCIAMAN